MPPQTIHAVIYKDAAGDQWVAQCIEYDVVTQGDSREHAVAMIKEAVELYLEDVSEKELELFYQPVEGDVTLHEVAIDAPTLLRS
ncbi:MAG TPA: type II toxin-antitoxin system HicB family antitoxin [Dehalococcoidia bacterium]|nr:type II toxin-antitoxin system HicB family antitoxin [Dehalococcoidia bacterium]